MSRRAASTVAYLLVCATCYAQETTPAQSDPPPFFDVEDISEPESEDPFQIHGRFDLTYWHFENSSNIDRFEQEEVNLISPALSLSYRLTSHLKVATEIEFDGLSGELEIDNLYVRGETATSHGFMFRTDLGVHYIPFGIERRYYSPATNPLVDRPSPFRRIFPGSYSDVGLFTATTYKRGGSTTTLEVAVTRALRGPDRDDRGTGRVRKYDQPQLSGRVGFEPRDGVSIGVSGLITNVERRGGSGHRRLDLIGLDAAWASDGWMARFEYLEGGFDGRASEGGTIRRDGWYAELYRKFSFDREYLQAIELVTRYDTIDENSRVRTFRDANRWAFGLNWIPHSQVRLKTEAVLSKERGDQIANNGLFVQLDLHF